MSASGPSILIEPEASAEPRAFRWAREDYYRLLDQGMFNGRRVELIDGEIIEVPAQKNRHAWSLSATEDEARRIVGPDCWVRSQMPLNLSLWSEPEPDIAVVSGSRESWRGKDHPASALLVIEISDTTLLYDRRVKQAIYAAAEIPEYWIVNLVDRQVEVFRSPQRDAANVRASRYGQSWIYGADDSFASVSFPGQAVAVARLLD